MFLASMSQDGACSKGRQVEVADSVFPYISPGEEGREER
jgi:hypothetical protein